MDPALLKEREKFINRQLAQPTIEKRKSQSSISKQKSDKQVKSFTATTAASGIDHLDLLFNVLHLCLEYFVFML